MKHARILAASCVGAMVCCIVAAPANANKAEYCAAYARDFADARATEKALWQHKYDIAQAACLAPPKAAPVIKVAAPKPKPKVQPVEQVAEIPPEPVPDPVPAPAPVSEKPTKKLRLILEPGSVAWNVYCGKKYTSFNPTTGTYRSRTGVERRCLVTG